jgi:hypothetical protein
MFRYSSACDLTYNRRKEANGIFEKGTILDQDEKHIITCHNSCHTRIFYAIKSVWMLYSTRARFCPIEASWAFFLLRWDRSTAFLSDREGHICLLFFSLTTRSFIKSPFWHLSAVSSPRKKRISCASSDEAGRWDYWTVHGSQTGLKEKTGVKDTIFRALPPCYKVASQATFGQKRW